ncbi:putative holin-like toxin [Halobacillus seohaensis]|uniref:Holin-like toxin n=1 Tax=Halobacillus seohaensis TaxID=447421 RepID=A0ABW2EPF9_9BACI
MMNIFEALTLMINFSMLMIIILRFRDHDQS